MIARTTNESDESVARYMLVQYMQDPRRRETRNIGVISWLPGAAECRFAPSDRVADIVNDRKNFDRWVEFWTDRIGKDSLEHHGRIADIESEEYFDLMLRMQNGNYLIVEAGESLDPLSPSELPDFTEDMFTQLVGDFSHKPKHDEAALSMKQRCSELFDELEIRHDHRLRRDEMVDLIIGKESCPVRFDYVWGDGFYGSLMQRVTVKDQKSVLSAFGMHQSVANSKVNPRCRPLSFVNTADAEYVENHIKILSSVCTVVDLSDITSAAEKCADILDLRA